MPTGEILDHRDVLPARFVPNTIGIGQAETIDLQDSTAGRDGEAKISGSRGCIDPCDLSSRRHQHEAIAEMDDDSLRNGNQGSHGAGTILGGAGELKHADWTIKDGNE
jgi:hypothetical protein